jgi:hypothetical protein
MPCCARIGPLSKGSTKYFQSWPSGGQGACYVPGLTFRRELLIEADIPTSVVEAARPKGATVQPEAEVDQARGTRSLKRVAAGEPLRWADTTYDASHIGPAGGAPVGFKTCRGAPIAFEHSR